MQRWDTLVPRYLSDYAARGVCGERVKMSGRELGRLGLWLKARRPVPELEKVDAELVVRYLRERTAFKAKATIAGVMSILRMYGNWLVQEGVWTSNPMKWLEGPKLDRFARVPQRLSTDSMGAMWKAAAEHPHAYFRHQRLAVLSLLYGMGLRRGEVQRLNVSDWNASEGLLVVDGRKTGRQRRLPAAEVVHRCLECYLPQRQDHLTRLGISEESALFIDRVGGRMTPRALSDGIHGTARRAQVPLASLHQFRHTCASDLLEAGVRLPEVQQVLGHQVISTTIRYLHLSDPQRRAAMELHPLVEWLKGGAV